MRPLAILADSNSKFSLDMCTFLSKQKYFKIEIIIFSKKSKNKNVKKIIKLFKYKVYYTKSQKPCLNKKVLKIIENKKIDICISTSFPHILTKVFLSYFKKGVINFHPSALPKNRGSHHSNWGILDNTNHGCTMHYMNSKVDAGNIIDQINYKNKNDLLAIEVYKKSHNLMLKLLKKNIKKIYYGTIRIKKINSKATYHKKSQINKSTTLNINKKIKINHLWKIIRATYFNSHGYYIKTKTKKYKIVSKIFEFKQNRYLEKKRT